MKIICTDLGRHDPWTIEPDYWPNQIPREGVHRFRCRHLAGTLRACRRDEQITLEAWPGIAAKLARHGITQLDISMIPHIRG